MHWYSLYLFLWRARFVRVDIVCTIRSALYAFTYCDVAGHAGFSVSFLGLSFSMNSPTYAVFKIASVVRLFTTESSTFVALRRSWTPCLLTSFTSGCVIDGDHRRSALIVKAFQSKAREKQSALVRFESAALSKTVVTVFHTPMLPKLTLFLRKTDSI